MIGFKVINYYKPGFGKVEWHMLSDLECISLCKPTHFFYFYKRQRQNNYTILISKDCIAVLKLSIVFTHKIVRVVLKCMTD